MAEDHARHQASPDARLGGWAAMHRNLAADAVLAEAELYAAGWRRLTVEHGGPLTREGAALLARLVEQVDDATAGAVKAGTVTYWATSITWSFPPTELPARQLVVTARLVADRLNPGGWVVTADDHP